MHAISQTYRSYLLRLWRVDEDGGQAWRASLEDPHTGERRGFNNLDGLMEFLKSQTEPGQDRQSELPETKPD